MADGKGCKCAAYSEAECGCDADWTPQAVYDLRAENERLKLTRYERHCIERVRDTYADEDDVACNEIAAVLADLLERTK
jgi:hypothetical protein